MACFYQILAKFGRFGDYCIASLSFPEFICANAIFFTIHLSPCLASASVPCATGATFLIAHCATCTGLCHRAAMAYLLLARRVVGYLSLISIVAVICAAFFLGFIARALFEQKFAHALLFLDAALASLCILMIHGRHEDALTALSAVESFGRRPNARQGAPTPGASAAPSAPQARRQTRANLVRNLLDKAADAALGPLATIIVCVPLGLGTLAAVAHVYGRHNVVASISGGLGAVCALLGTGPYFIGRYMLDRQFDKIVRVFVGDENQPLLEEI